MPVLSIVGVPSSAASYAAGQELAPRALRDAGLVGALGAAGWAIEDAGDLTEQVWAPDPHKPFAQNVDQVALSVRELGDLVPDLLREDRRLLVVGGNCTIALGVMAGLDTLFGPDCGLLYIDRHFDMNTPLSTIEGALDWMGVAHALDLPGSDDALAGAFRRRPLLHAHRLAMLGIDPSEATDFERARAAELNLHVTSQSDLIADPAAATRAALEALPPSPFAVHIDVDVLDFVDAPLAESTNGRNTGPTLVQLGEALRVAVTDPRWLALSIGEINPTRSAGQPDALPRLIAVLAAALATW
ncbi:arginase family protein [Jatrophihabitans sp. DSM 45814]